MSKTNDVRETYMNRPISRRHLLRGTDALIALPALESLGWERVDVMLRRHDHVHVQRALYNDQCPPAMSAMFTRRAEVSSRDTRAVAAGKLQLPKWRLARTQREFAYRAAASWNAKDTATGT